MWSNARYNLRVSSDEFLTLTPKQYHLLNDRFLEELVHRETVAAITTAAVYNSSFNPPDEPINPSRFIFNRSIEPSKAPALTSEQMEDFNARSAQLQIELKSYQVTGIPGPLMKELSIVKEAHE